MRHSSYLLFVVLSLGDAAWASAQDTSAPRALTAVRLLDSDVLRIDGIPDETVWERAQPATDFIQRDPANGAPATERTEVRVLYDTDRLVIGVVLHDTEPARVLGNQMQRDQSFQADDRFMLTLDTFLDGRSGYYFEVNPAGAMGDGLINPGDTDEGLGAGVNDAWDGIWLARVQRTATGWSAEIEIPFRTVNFAPAGDAWGVNFQRTVRRKNEESLWTGFARNLGLTRMSNAGRLEGLGGMSQGMGLDLKPYAVGNVSSAPGRGRSGAVATGDVGFDVFYNLTPALRANVSVNTDFAETEVDDRQVNLTRFPLFFEEKRDFFLQGSSYFDFARDLGNQIMPFFSRRIGLDGRGQPQPIHVGAKVTGQVGAFDVGALQVRAGESVNSPGADFSVLRVRRRAFEQSYIGGLYTRRSDRTPGASDAQTAGIDASLRTSRFRGDQTIDLSGYYIWTSNPLDTGDSSAFGARLQYPNDPFAFDVYYREIQPNYDPRVGFLQRTGIRVTNPDVEYVWRFDDHPWLRSWETGVDLQFINDPDNRSLTRDLGFTPISLEFNDGSEASFTISRQFERLDEDFEISDGVILPFGGEYGFTRYAFEAETADQYPVSVNGSVVFGDFFSGDRQEYGFGVDLRPRPGVALSLETEHNVLNLAQGSFSTDVFRLAANTQFSPWLSLVNNLQYDSVSRQLGWQMRFRWIQRPGNDLFLVYTHNWEELSRPDGPARFGTLDNRLATKIAYTLRF